MEREKRSTQNGGALLLTHRILDKSLVAYSMDSICGSPSFKSNERTCQKLGQHVSYFNCGVCNGKPLVIFMKKKGMDSQFKAIEPICGDLRDPKNTKFKTGRTGFLSKSHEWFKTYRVRKREKLHAIRKK